MDLCGMYEGETPQHDISLDAIIEDRRWFADNYASAHNTVSFVHTNREILARQPFLDQRWRAQGPRNQFPLELIAARFPHKRPTATSA